MNAPGDVQDRALDGVLAALANPLRRRILAELAAGDRSVSALAAPFDVSRPAVSQHLRILHDAGLVSERRAGRERRYRLEPERLRLVQQWLRAYERFWGEKLTALGAYLDAGAADEKDSGAGMSAGDTPEVTP